MTLRSPFRQTAAVAAGALIGLAWAIAFVAPASAHSGELTVTSSCTDTEWEATWSLTTTGTGGADAVISAVASGIETPRPSGVPEHGSPLRTFDNDAKITGDGTFTEVQTLRAHFTEATLSFTLTWDSGDGPHVKTVAAKAIAPTNCTWKPPTPRLDPSWNYVRNCAGIRVALDNPAEFIREVKLHVKPSHGKEITLIAQPGEHKSATVPGESGLTVVVTPEGFRGDKANAEPDGPETISYQRSSSCDKTSDSEPAVSDGVVAGSGAGGNGGGLPVTGAAAGMITVAAAVLLAAGAGMFMAARRRRVKFTA